VFCELGTTRAMVPIRVTGFKLYCSVWNWEGGMCEGCFIVPVGGGDLWVRGEMGWKGVFGEMRKERGGRMSECINPPWW
jgi:hypothetical protein